MFRFLSFGSGSSGNSYYIQTDEGGFLIDAGVAIRRFYRYLTAYRINPQSIRSIFLTHDHSDHVKCAGMFATKYNLPVFATEDTWKGICANPTIRNKTMPELRHVLNKKVPVECCGCYLTPFEVPHDSCDNVGYSIEYGGHHLCIVTDAGHVTGEILDYVSQADDLILEANYDEEMLRTGSYPFYLKQRIKGSEGHLSNEEAADIIYQNSSHLNGVWLCHLSENNNTPEKALSTVLNHLQENGIDAKDSPAVHVLKRLCPSEFFDLL